MKQALFFILIIVLSGCSVSRKTAVKEDVKLVTAEKVVEKEKETTNQSSYTDTSKEVKINVSDKSETRITDTEYSEPDENGNQHKKRETVTETRNDITVLNEKNERIISEQLSEIERLVSVNSELQTKLEASNQVTTKTSTRPPFWTYIIAFVLGAVVVLCTRKWLCEKFKR